MCVNCFLTGISERIRVQCDLGPYICYVRKRRVGGLDTMHPAYYRGYLCRRAGGRGKARAESQGSLWLGSACLHFLKMGNVFMCCLCNKIIFKT